MQLSIQVETVNLGWTRWKQIIAQVEALEYAGLYVSDHFAAPVPMDAVGIDAWTALTCCAVRSKRLRFGSLVSPITFRDPVILARQAMDLYELSRGRFVLGIGRVGPSVSTRCLGGDLMDRKPEWTASLRR